MTDKNPITVILKRAWNTVFPYCGEMMYNEKYKFAIQKMCCSETTYYPEQSFECDDLSQDIDSLLLKNFSSDAIYSACSWQKGKPPQFRNVKTTTYPPLPSFSHIPIQCSVDDLSILSIGLSGLCHREKPSMNNSILFQQNSLVVNTSVNQPSTLETIAIDFFQAHLAKVDVVCLQNIYLPDFIDTRGKVITRLLGGNTDFKIYYDGYTGAILVRNELIKNKPNTRSILKKGGTRKVRGGGDNQMISFPKVKNKPQQSIIKVTKRGKTTFIVNVSLSPLYHSKKKNIHENEMRPVLDYLKNVNAFSHGVIFIGDHKHNNVDLYKLK